MNLLSLSLTAAVSPAAVGGSAQFNCQPRAMCAQLNFTYGSGGTSADFYLQTSLDGGATWSDVANWHVTTASVRSAYNVSSQTPKTTAVTLTDGSLTANTCNDGLLGVLWRVKYQSTGTYVATTATVDIQADQVTR